MYKINIKESILEIVEKNNLEILKIDLMNDEESFVRSYSKERNEFCKAYTTLEDLDFEVESIFMHDEVRGAVYCRDKNTKEPVWIVSRGDEGGSWWEVNRVPYFYKDKKDKEISKEKAIKHIKTIKSYINCIHEDLSNDIKIKAFGLAYKFVIQECDKAIKELKD